MYGKLPVMADVVPHEIKNEGPPKGTKREKFKPNVYVAERIIGNGSFGVVYKAMQQNVVNKNQPGETVAIKKVF